MDATPHFYLVRDHGLMMDGTTVGYYHYAYDAYKAFFQDSDYRMFLLELREDGQYKVVQSWEHPDWLDDEDEEVK